MPNLNGVRDSVLLHTIKHDLNAGVSWFEHEAEDVGLFLWNTLKSAFIALEPLEGQILMDILSAAVLDAAGGKSIEEIESHALNLATDEQKSVLLKAGSGIVQTVIAGIKAGS